MRIVLLIAAGFAYLIGYMSNDWTWLVNCLSLVLVGSAMCGFVYEYDDTASKNLSLTLFLLFGLGSAALTAWQGALQKDLTSGLLLGLAAFLLLSALVFIDTRRTDLGRARSDVVE